MLNDTLDFLATQKPEGIQAMKDYAIVLKSLHHTKTKKIPKRK